jgi:kynurenine formamidase
MSSRRFRAIAASLGLLLSACAAPPRPPGLWRAYQDSFAAARYVDLTHAIAPGIPVWAGFGQPRFGQARDPKAGRPYSYRADGFEANRYALPTDQLGTQLDPPAHWNPSFPAIDELPATYTLRPLAVISIVDQAARDPGYPLQVADILAWERRHGRIPEGAVVFVRSDWSKSWPDPRLAGQARFPGVGLAALKFLHLQRKILFHGHEPLDTDATPNLEGEAWLLRHGYVQAEGVANLWQVPEAGALVAIGFPKFKGGLGGYARFVAICPPDWPFGTIPDSGREAPLPRKERALHWDEAAGARVR